MSDCRAAAARAAALALFVCSAAAAQTGPVAWRELRSEAGFRVSLPGPYERTSETAMTGAGLVTQTYLAARHRNATFRVGCSEFAGGVPAPAALMLDAMRDEWLAGVEGRLERESAIEVGGAPGLEWAVALSGGRALRARVFVTTRRIYSLTVETTAEQLGGEEFRSACRTFFDSFALSPP